MKKNSRNNARKERIIMIASSAFVLTALTMTGIYMKSNTAEQEDDGYTIDFTALEDNVQEKRQEIAQGTGEDDLLAGVEDPMENDLDYMPMEAGSGLVELPGLTDRQQEGPVSDKPAVPQETTSTGKAPEEAPEVTSSTEKAPEVKDVPQEAPKVEAPPVEEAPKTDTPAPETEGRDSSSQTREAPKAVLRQKSRRRQGEKSCILHPAAAFCALSAGRC